MAAAPPMHLSSAAAAAAEKSGKTLAFAHFQKTRLCSYNNTGSCMYGANCFFAHNSDELQKPVSLRKTSLCQAFLSGSCPHKAAACKFAHGKRELRRVIPGEVRPLPCKSERRQHRRRGGGKVCVYASEASTADSLPSVEPEDIPSSEAEGSDSSGLAASSDPDVPDAASHSAPVSNKDDSERESLQQRTDAANKECRDGMSHYVREVGSEVLPALFWQGTVYLGNVHHLLHSALPQFYED